MNLLCVDTRARRDHRVRCLRKRDGSGTKRAQTRPISLRNNSGSSCFCLCRADGAIVLVSLVVEGWQWWRTARRQKPPSVWHLPRALPYIALQMTQRAIRTSQIQIQWTLVWPFSRRQKKVVILQSVRKPCRELGERHLAAVSEFWLFARRLTFSARCETNCVTSTDGGLTEPALVLLKFVSGHGDSVRINFLGFCLLQHFKQQVDAIGRTTKRVFVWMWRLVFRSVTKLKDSKRQSNLLP